MLTIKNLTKQYHDEYALRDVSLSIGRGINFVVGASGSGKTTLLRILSGMENNFEGSVTYGGMDIAACSMREKSSIYHSVFGFVWQDFQLLEEATVLENVRICQYLDSNLDHGAVMRILRQMKIEDLRDKKVRYLSGGQKQRVAIARELMKNPRVIFCDEPTSALDAKTAAAIIRILRSLAKDRTVVVVTHDTSLITAKDNIFELDKGELISGGGEKPTDRFVCKVPDVPVLTFQNAFRIAAVNLKNKVMQYLISVITLMVAGTLLLTTVCGAIGDSGQKEFDKLLETYGEGILDLQLVGSFMGAGGGAGKNEKKPNGDVSQNLSGLYEKYQEDDRVEFIISMQAFENIRVSLSGKKYSIKSTGNSPVLSKLESGSIPAGDDFQVVVPQKFADQAGITSKQALGQQIDFSATVYQWVNNQPVEKSVHIRAKVCGVGDNTVVYDYNGKTSQYSVDDSFFFNRAANDEIRRQAGIEDNSGNFIIRAKTPEDLISLKDELNRSGIVPLGQFELLEDIVRLNQQTARQSGTASVVIGVLGCLAAAAVYAMMSFLRKREYAIYKVGGYHNGHLTRIAAAEMVLAAVGAVFLMVILSPVIDMASRGIFDTSILSAGKLGIGALLVLAAAVLAFAAELPAYITASVSAMLKVGDRS